MVANRISDAHVLVASAEIIQGARLNIAHAVVRQRIDFCDAVQITQMLGLHTAKALAPGEPPPPVLRPTCLER